MTIRQQIHNLIYGENMREANRNRLLMSRTLDERIGIELMGLVMPAAGEIWGIDGSHWNEPPMAIQHMKDVYGLNFAIFKGCDGSVNTRFYTEHKQAAKDAGIPWGMYVWLYPNNKVSIEAQVNAWHARYIVDPPPMGIFIDAEWTNYAGRSANPTAADLRTAHDKWRAKSGTRATTYTAKGYADQYLHGFDWSQEDLWVASYGGNAPLMPHGATKHQLWQFTSTLDGHALDPNGNAELDGNYWSGTPEEFATRYGAVTLPPPIGEPMTQWYRVNTYKLQIRAGSGANYADIGDLWQGDRIQVDAAPLGGWLRIVSILRVSGTTETFTPAASAWCSAAYCIAVTPPVVVPPVEPPAGGPDVHIDIQLKAGSTITVTDEAGAVVWSVTA